MTAEDWEKPFVRSLGFLLGGDAIPTPDEQGQRIVGDTLLVLLNAHHEPMTFTLPAVEWGADWELVVDTGGDALPQGQDKVGATLELKARSTAVLRHRTGRE